MQKMKRYGLVDTSVVLHGLLVSVCCEPYKNGRPDRHAVWDEDSVESKKPCIRRGHYITSYANDSTPLKYAIFVHIHRVE